jgi:uncharacterized LabA/DUF88 family protein
VKTKVTYVRDIPFFVTDKFIRTYARERYELGLVERMVETSYRRYLINECENQKTSQIFLESDWYDDDGFVRMLRKAKEFEPSRCFELRELFGTSKPSASSVIKEFLPDGW